MWNVYYHKSEVVDRANSWGDWSGLVGGLVVEQMDMQADRQAKGWMVNLI